MSESYEITLHRTELVPGGNGALIGYSDEFPDMQFLLIPDGGGVSGTNQEKQ